MIHSECDNLGFMIYSKADGDIEQLFESLPKRYQIGSETSIKVSDFIFECVHSLHYRCHKINLNHGVPYIDDSLD